MNLAHRCLCRSRRRKNEMETHIAPWALDGIDDPFAYWAPGPFPALGSPATGVALTLDSLRRWARASNAA